MTVQKWLNLLVLVCLLTAPVSGLPIQPTGGAPAPMLPTAPKGHYVSIVPDEGFSGTLALETKIVGYNAVTPTQFLWSSAAYTAYLPLIPRHFEPLPPNPADVAPPLDRTVATTLYDATRFLYEGDPPIQTGVAPGTIDPERVAVIRGRVLDQADEPLSRVKITILDHPEYGQTLSRVDGMFDMVVNGGTVLTVQYERLGHLPAQRQVEAPWQDYVWVPDVVLVPADLQVTAVDLTQTSEEFVVAQGSVISDTDGTRQATLLFPQGIQAELVLPGGVTQTISNLNVRATEYTVGENGPQKMPAELPPVTGYTYAAEFSADEALATGASDVQFDQPLYSYLEDFIGFPVGSAVPSGYYDEEAGQWVGSENGRVVEILTITAGLAELDTDGDGLVDNGQVITPGLVLTITDAEREKLALLYPEPPQALWRVPINHFSPWDYNWPYGPPEDARPPNQPDPEGGKPIDDPCNDQGYSVIECQNQILGERVSLVGTPFTLNYRSDRVPGRKAAYSLTIFLSGDSVPDSLAGIWLRISVAGRQFNQSFSPQSNRTDTFTWDGRDAFSRTLQGPQPIVVRIGYVYPMVYYPVRSDRVRAWARFRGGSGGSGGAGMASSRASIIVLWQTWTGAIGSWDTQAQGLGGWSLDVQHAYEFYGRTLHLGDGRRRSVESVPAVIRTVAGGATAPPPDYGDGGPATAAALFFPRGIAVAPDGSFYIADTNRHRIRRVGPDGIITTVAGTGIGGFSGDGGPAIAAQLSQPWRVAVAPDGSLYIADLGNDRVRRVGSDGIITTVAGGGSGSCEGCPATEVFLNNPRGIAVAPDGSLYIAHTNYIRHVGPDGNISTVAGTGSSSSSGDGGLATEASIHGPYGVAVAPDGSLYIATAGGSRIRCVGTDGIITTTVGTGVAGFGGDGGPATLAQLNAPYDVAVAPDGSLYIADYGNHRVRHVNPDGIITTAAGTGIPGSDGDGGPATAAQLNTPAGVAVASDGSCYVVEEWNQRIRQVLAPLSGFSANDVAIPSVEGSELYQLDVNGRHRRTLNALTGAVRYQLAYDDSGFLVTVEDGDGNITTIERDAAGNPTAIVGPYGQRTTLSLDANGYLASISNPAGETHTFTYTDDGLLTERTDPRNSVYRYTYGGGGRLVRAEDPLGGFKELARAKVDEGHEVSITTAEGRTTTYQVERLPSGEKRLVNTFPNGLSNEVLIGTDGSRVVTFADGTVVTEVQGPDPRWGMLAPLVEAITVTTPGGLQFVSQQNRTATLGDPSDPLSLEALTDVLTINGRAYSSMFEAGSGQITSTSPEGRQTFIWLDDQGRVLKEQEAGFPYAIHYTYDAQGRLDTIVEGPGNDPTVDRVYNVNYDTHGYVERITDPLGRTVDFAYDDAGRVTGQTYSDGRQIGSTYDLNGNVASITPPERPPHAFSYTPVDLVDFYTPPPLPSIPNPATDYDYNLDRDLDLITRPDGQTIDLAYNATMNRLESIGLPGGREIAFDYYDGAPPGEPDTGQLYQISVHPADDTVTYTYDGALLVEETWAGAVQGSVGRIHNDDLRIQSMYINAANFFSATFGYDDDGLLEMVRARMPAAGLTTDLAIVLDADNGLVAGTALDSITTAQAYNGFGELASFDAAFGGSSIFSTTYDTVSNPRDKLGRIVDLNETVTGVSTGYRYAYDKAGRLSDVWKNGAHVSHYGYDANGNRITHTHPVSGSGIVPADVVYDDQDRLLQYGDKSYTYTPNGELLTKTETGQTTHYEYDVLGNLRAVTLPDGTEIAYVVDGRNRRIGKKVDGVLVQGFLYQDQLNPLAELDGDNNVVSVFGYATQANVPDYMLSRKADGVTWVAYRIISDHLGSPRLVLNASTGEIVQRMDYDEFGRVTKDTNPGFQPFGFAGGLYDQQTGLIRFGARDYNPVVGRWVCKDPILFLGGDANLYGYVLSDPINFVDANGLDIDAGLLFDAALLALGSLIKIAGVSWAAPLAPVLGVLAWADILSRAFWDKDLYLLTRDVTSYLFYTADPLYINNTNGCTAIHNKLMKKGGWWVWLASLGETGMAD